ECPGAEPRVDLRPVRGDQPPLGRPRQRSAEGPTSDRGERRPRLGRPGRLRCPPLLFLETLDECLKPSRGLRQFTDHALVIGALVTHLREETAALPGFAIDFRALLLGLAAKRLELGLSSLLARLALGQPVTCYKILLNEPSVHCRERRKVAQDDRPADGVVAAEHHREGPTLGLDRVDRAEPGAERGLLLGFPAL